LSLPLRLAASRKQTSWCILCHRFPLIKSHNLQIQQRSDSLLSRHLSLPALNITQASGWTFSVLVNGNRAYGSYTNGLGSTYQSSRSSAASEIAAFVQTASNYSIPADVTVDDTTTTFFSRPDWYTALPSGARSFKERQVSDQFSIVRSVIAARQTTATSTGRAVPTAQAFLDAKFGAMAAAAAAVFL
jgi:hypothetical protein